MKVRMTKLKKKKIGSPIKMQKSDILLRIYNILWIMYIDEQ
jgi:hypothetical protein